MNLTVALVHARSYGVPRYTSAIVSSSLECPVSLAFIIRWRWHIHASRRSCKAISRHSKTLR